MNFLLAAADRLPASSTTTEASSTISSTIISTSSVSPHTETLVQLCRLWPHLHNPVPDPPPFCQDLLPPGAWQHQQPDLPDIHDRYSTHFGTSSLGDRTIGVDLVQTGFQYTGRSLSLISVLGGILVILVIIAFISCYKHRKRVVNGENFSVELFTSHLRNLQNLSSAQQLQLLGRQPDECPGPPPDYETVIKQREEEENGLPTYSVAVERRNTGVMKEVYHSDNEDDCIAEYDCEIESSNPSDDSTAATVTRDGGGERRRDTAEDRKQDKEKTTQ